MPIVSVNMMIHHDSPNADSITGPSNQSLFVDVSADSRCIQHKPPLESIGPYFYRPTSLSLQLELSKVMGGYPQIVHFHRIFHHKTNHFGGSPIFRKPRRWTPDSVPTPDCATFAAGSLDASESSQQPYVKRTSKMKMDTMVNLQMGVSENSVPPNPMVNDHYPY